MPHKKKKREYINSFTIPEGTATDCGRQGKSNNPCYWKAWLQDTKPSLATWVKFRKVRTQLPQDSTMPKSVRTMTLHPTRIFWLCCCPIQLLWPWQLREIYHPCAQVHALTPPGIQVSPVLLERSADPTPKVSSKTLKWHWSRMKPATTILMFVCILKQKEITISF